MSVRISNTARTTTASTSHVNKTTSSRKTSSIAKSSTKTGNSKTASSNKASSTSKSGTKTSSKSSGSAVTGRTKNTTANVSTSKSNVTSSVPGSIKYIADAPAIYTNKGCKSAVGNTAFCLASKFQKDYIPGMPSEIYNKIKESKQSKYHGKTSDINKMLSNLDKDKSLKLTADQKTAILVTGEKLLNKGYKPKFVAGVLGNIMNEGLPGQFEQSNYKTNPEKKPAYLKNMDKDFDYTKNYSGKNIGEVGIKETVQLQENASKKKHRDNGKVVTDKFGIGMCQFTGDRAGDVLRAYQKFYDKTGENHPSKEQCLEIEVDFMLKEIKGKKYKNIYEDWKKENKTAYSAGYSFCIKYETPADKVSKGKERGNNAEKIYKVMKEK